MGRPSKLTEPMKVEIGKRLAAGESLRAVSKDLKIAYSTLRDNFSDHVTEIRDVAQALASAETRLLALPVSAQQSARSLAEQMKAIQSDYAKAASTGVKNALRLHGLAEKKLKEVDEDNLTIEGIGETMLVVDGLTKTANRSASLAARLVTDPKTEDKERTLEDLLEEANQLRRKA